MSRTTQGRLYRKYTGGNWYVQYYVNGMQHREVLRDSDGRPISDKEKASEALGLLMATMRMRDEVERRKRVLESVSSAEMKAEHLEKQAMDRMLKAEAIAARKTLSIENGWDLFLSCSGKPKSCRKLTPGSPVRRNTTAGNYHCYFRALCLWAKRNKLECLLDLSRQEMCRFLDDTGESDATYNKYRMFFKCFFRTLISEKILDMENPMEGIPEKDAEHHSKEPLSVDQIRQMVDAAEEDDVKLLVQIGYYTGLRLGDCATLRWSEVDLARGIIRRIPNKTGHRVSDRSQAMVKVGINDELCSALSGCKADGAYVLPRLAEMYRTKPYAVSEIIADLFRKVGIETSERQAGGQGGKTIYNRSKGSVVKYGFHSLRYSYISHNAMAGTPQAILQRNAGHSNQMMTEHYTKISDEAARKYANVLSLGDGNKAGLEELKARLAAWIDNADINELRRLCEQLGI